VSALKALDFKYAWLQLMAGRHGPSNPNTRLVLFVLSLHMKKTGADCWPSAQHIAMRSGLSERAVREHIKLAVAAGWLSVTARSGVVNVYFPVIPKTAIATIGRKPGVKMKPWLQKANGLSVNPPAESLASSASVDGPTPAPAAEVALFDTPEPIAGVLTPAESEPQAPALGAPHPGTTVRGPLHQVQPNSSGNYQNNNPRPDSPSNGFAGTLFAKRLKGRTPESESEASRKHRIKALLSLPEFTDDASIAKVARVTVDEVRLVRTLQ
jgi:hypothetical protein